MQNAHISEFDRQVHFIIDYILTELNKDRTLLLFISKNLAWGVFKGAFEEKMPDDEYNFISPIWICLLKADYIIKSGTDALYDH